MKRVNGLNKKTRERIKGTQIMDDDLADALCKELNKNKERKYEYLAVEVKE